MKRLLALKQKGIVYNRDYSPLCDDNGIAHAVMFIHGQKVFLNDRFGKKEATTDIAMHLIVMFKTKDEFLSCYDVMKEGRELFYDE